jgi:hypothetical protein
MENNGGSAFPGKKLDEIVKAREDAELRYTSGGMTIGVAR